MKRIRTDRTDLLVAALVIVLILAGALLYTIADAHPSADCYESSPYCEYVQIATPGGGVKMAYVCD